MIKCEYVNDVMIMVDLEAHNKYCFE